MDYQTLTLKELKDLLRDRNIAGRSKATTKEKAIALLEECDRLSAENLPAPVEETLISREIRHYISSAGEGWLDENDEWTEDAAKACPYTVSELSAKLAELRRSGKKGLQTSFDIVENFTGSPPSPPAPSTFPEPEPEPEDESKYTDGVQPDKCAQCGSFETWPERDGGYWCENCNYRFTLPAPPTFPEPEPEPELDPKADCLKATLEKAAKLKSLMQTEKEQKINRRERIETSNIQSPSGASVNQDCQETRCSSINAESPQIIPQPSDDNKNNSDFAERLAEQIWRSPLAFIDHNGQAAKRVSLLEAEILASLSPDSVYRLIIFDTYGQVIIMSPAASSPAPARQASAPASEFFLSFVSGGGKRYWLGQEDDPTPNPSRAEAYSERHAKAKAAYHRQFPHRQHKEFPNIQLFERSQNQWYEHRLVQAGKSWRERSIYEVVPVNPIDLSPRSPPCTA